jgi:hypothetical protein
MPKHAYVNVEKDEDGFTVELVVAGYEKDIFHTQDEDAKDNTVRMFQERADEENKFHENHR